MKVAILCQNDESGFFFSYEPACITTIILSLRRTLHLQQCCCAFQKLVPFTGLILQYNIEQCVRNKILMQTPIPYFCRGFGSEDDALSPYILQIK